MKSMRLEGSEQRPTLAEQDVPRPRPGAGEVLVRVCSAGVTPTEVIWYPTSHTKSGGPRTGAVPSHEFSGQVADTAEEIYGMNDWFADGAMAEYCLTRPEWIAPKPRGLTHAEAASVPIGALTAWQGLFERAKLQPAERVLIHGGAGAVGIYAIQLARSRGAHVTATVSARNLEFARELGANRVVDYQAAPFEESVKDIDIVFDTVGGDTLRRSWGVLNSNGRMITIAAGGEVPDERTKAAFFIVEPNREQLVEIARLLDAGEIRPLVDTTLPLSNAADAFSGTVHRTGRGRVVVTVAEPVRYDM